MKRIVSSLALTLVLLQGVPALCADKEPDLFQKGLMAYRSNQLQEALSYFQQAAQADEKNLDALYNLGAIYFNLKRYPEALDAFNKLLQIDPNDQTIRYETGRVYEKLGRTQEAIAAFEMVGPNSSRYTKAQENLTRLREPKPEATTAQSQEQAKPEAQQTKSIAEAYLASSSVPSSGKVAVEEFVNGLYGPTGLAVDAKGMLYVANFSKNTIYRVSAAGEKKLLAAGKGINGPVGLALDHKTGNLYIANHLDNTVSQVTPSGVVTVVATGLKKPYNLYLDEPNRTLYVSQQETNSIARIKLN